MMCSVSVVLPLDSGPKISSTRPRGTPTPPRAMSRLRLPVGMPSIGCDVVAVELHDGAFAELLFDLLNGPREGRIASRIATLTSFGTFFDESFAESFPNLRGGTSFMTGSGRGGFGVLLNEGFSHEGLLSLVAGYLVQPAAESTQTSDVRARFLTVTSIQAELDASHQNRPCSAFVRANHSE